MLDAGAIERDVRNTLNNFTFIKISLTVANEVEVHASGLSKLPLIRPSGAIMPALGFVAAITSPLLLGVYYIRFGADW